MRIPPEIWACLQIEQMAGGPLTNQLQYLNYFLREGKNVYVSKSFVMEEIWQKFQSFDQIHGTTLIKKKKRKKSKSFKKNTHGLPGGKYLLLNTLRSYYFYLFPSHVTLQTLRRGSCDALVWAKQLGTNKRSLCQQFGANMVD